MIRLLIILLVLSPKILLGASFTAVTNVIGTDTNLILLPTFYNASTNYPLVIYHHGNNGSYFDPLNSPVSTIITPLVTNGYIVLSQDAGRTNWGNQAELDMYNLGISNVCANYSIATQHIVIGSSMGGVSGHLQVTNAAGFIGIFPVCDLFSMYAGFTATLNGDYGITPGGSDFHQKTTNHDPIFVKSGLFTGVRMRYFCSPDDVTVLQNSNTWPMVTNVLLGSALEYSIVECTGPHGSSDHYRPDDVLAFVQRINTNTPWIAAVPLTLNFGTLLTNTTSSLTFYVTNTMSGTLTGTVTASGSPFSITAGGTPYQLITNGVQVVTVKYSPTVAANNSGTVTLTGSKGAVVTLSGSATNSPDTSTIGVSPSSLNFGTLLTNTSASLTFVVTNTGISTLVGTASTSSPFSIISGSPYAVGVNSSAVITVQYSPTVAASDSGTVTCTGGGGATVSLSGSATNAPFFGVMTKISGNVTISGTTVIK